MSDLTATRARFAEQLAAGAGLRSPALLRAFAVVPREDFLAPGPWLMLPDEHGYRSTPDANPVHVYQDLAIAIDPGRLLNNGAPGFLARLIDSLDLAPGEHVVHLGCGTGYYSAILAELVGRSGHVTAVELDPALAGRAERALRDWKQVRVLHADATLQPEEPVDAILVNAGVTHPRARWLDALRPGGRLVAPLTAVRPPTRLRRIVRDHAGRVLHVRRQPGAFAARLLERCAIGPLVGGRDRVLQEALRAAFEADFAAKIASLRRAPHAPEPECWLHGPDFCLSRRAPRAE